MPLRWLGERKMKQRMRGWLTLRMPAKQKAVLDQFADEREISVGEAARQLIAAGLEAKKW